MNVVYKYCGKYGLEILRDAPPTGGGTPLETGGQPQITKNPPRNPEYPLVGEPLNAPNYFLRTPAALR
jgi:hypothetical protein